MRIEICPSGARAAAQAAELIAGRLRAAIAERGHATVALSGGRTPVPMLGVLAATPIAWSQVHVFQVDERWVDAEDPRSNIRTISRAFRRAGSEPDHLYRMPVGTAAAEPSVAPYVHDLRAAAGTPPRLDVVHLGLGTDGHTASLFPGDAALEAEGEVTLTGIHGGLRRTTLTLRALDRARVRVWLVTGASKSAVVKRLFSRDPALVAGMVRRPASILVLDREAAAEIR